MMAQLFLAVFAHQALIGSVIEPFRIAMIQNFPNGQQNKRHSQKTPGIHMFYINEWGEHHRIVPVIYAASTAALVFQKPRLERAEKQDADHIAYGICQCDQQQNALINDVGVKQHSN